MRRIALVPLLLAVGLLAGCAQVTQAAGDAFGVPVAETCATIDDAYAQYQQLLSQGDASAEQLDAARDDLVATLDGVADGMDGQLGDLIRSGADQLGGMTDLQAPETVEAIERLHDGLSSFCG
ncbi:hypothetical protein [Microbacterium paraoxydans]|uniref:Lipoprotein n=1 Tax=Microbacterium paraoxydans TaxID=199592 RepID=A0A1H1QWV2_9MICO|nr:hypothetical protein [Microbacterium paraoxydans]SDS27850.1 hypothetical protein SAMN04489809_1497 [Microbacterium paraoxydans]